MLARVGASLRKAASLFNGMPDELPAVRSIARFDGAPGGAYAATVHTDREWGGRSRATFRVGNPGASGSPVCAVFEGFIDKRPSDASLRNSVPLAPSLAYQGFLTDDGARGWRDFELPFTSFGDAGRPEPRPAADPRHRALRLLSIAVADDLEGPFRIELAAIDATREPGRSEGDGRIQAGGDPNIAMPTPEDVHERPLHKLYFLITGMCNCGIKQRVGAPPERLACRPCPPPGAARPTAAGVSWPPAADGRPSVSPDARAPTDVALAGVAAAFVAAVALPVAVAAQLLPLVRARWGSVGGAVQAALEALG
ncbi:hypothetical protein SO694_000731103 [Aureococcus anophagefferens]|uniref:NADH:ubiquinone oxidoreductase intermediate-associated protein 30 domain-containing protein n=1 Tax=Aureococcus anophagefferens TaxID=44056 RepID=A0ABR1FID6_AURAN